MEWKPVLMRVCATGWRPRIGRMSKAAPAIAFLSEAALGRGDAAARAGQARCGARAPTQRCSASILASGPIFCTRWGPSACRRGNGTKRRSISRQALKANPKEARHLVPLARAYVQSGKNDQAIEGTLIAVAARRSISIGTRTGRRCCTISAPAGREGRNGVKGSLIDRLIAAHPKNCWDCIRSASACAGRWTRSSGGFTYLEAICTARRRAQRAEVLRRIRRHAAQQRPVRALPGACRAMAERAIPILLDLAAGLCAAACICRVSGEHAKGARRTGAKSARARRTDHSSRASVGIIKLMVSGLKEGFEEFAATRDKVIKIGNFQVIPLPEWNGETLAGASA